MPHKILILSCNTGEGHNSAAKALKRTIENDGMQCDIYDALGLAGKRLSNKVSRIYDNSVKNSLFSTGYAIGEWYSSIRFKPRSPVYRFNKTYATEIYHLICGNGYDAVVCTHPFPALSVSFIKEKYGLCIPSFFVATDYTCYPFMNETDLDGYMIAHSDLIEEYVRKGVPAEKIYPTGIPCRADNLVGKIPQKEARQELDEIYSFRSQSLDGRWFLIMGGSMGLGNMNELIGHLLNKCSPKDRIVCICGRNQEQEREIQGMYPESSIVKVVGYTDRVMLFMDACDVLFTKPGGLTSTEALNRGVPLIHTAPIKGIEDKNAHFFHDRGMSYSSTDPQLQSEFAFRLCEEKDCRMVMLQSQMNNRMESASADILKIIKQKIQ